MKKTLNIAYLNGADGFRKSAVQSGGNGDGESDVETNAEYYRIDWDKAKELGYTDDNITNNASFFIVLNGIIHCNEFALIQDDVKQKIADLHSVWFMRESMPAYCKFSGIGEVKFVPYTSLMQIEPKVYNSLKECWEWEQQPFEELFIPITKEEFYSLK